MRIAQPIDGEASTKVSWHFGRPALAEHYYNLLFDSGIRRLALFGRRRIGKTEFLLQDLVPLAQQKSTGTLYCSLWENKDSPQSSLIQALLQATKTKGAQGSSMKGRLQLSLPDMAEAEIEVERAQHPKAATTSELSQLTASWREWLKQRGTKPVLVIFDEIQHLASSARFATLAATLRTLLDMAPANVRVIFTGSSHADLHRLFTNNKAPFFQFADIVPFQPMSHDFVQHLEGIFQRITSLVLPSDSLGKLFELTGRNAHVITGLTQRLVIFRTTDVEGMWQDIADNLVGPEGWCEQQWSQLSSSDRTVYLQLLREQEPFSEASLKMYARASFSRATAQKALLRLENKGLISRLGHGQYLREVPMLDLWIRDQKILLKK